MADATEHVRALARRVVDAALALGPLRPAALAGSGARGDADRYSDVDLLLRGEGFSLYGLYPHYRSTKAVDPQQGRSEERLMWADAVFFKDPFDDLNAGKTFAPRAIDCLILAALLTGFHDFASELARKCVAENEGREALIQLARDTAVSSAGVLLDDFAKLKKGAGYLEIRRFVDRNISNSSTDFFTG